jgi:hypothetical protein
MGSKSFEKCFQHLGASGYAEWPVCLAWDLSAVILVGKKRCSPESINLRPCLMCLCHHHDYSGASSANMWRQCLYYKCVAVRQGEICACGLHDSLRLHLGKGEGDTTETSVTGLYSCMTFLKSGILVIALRGACTGSSPLLDLGRTLIVRD